MHPPLHLPGSMTLVTTLLEDARPVQFAVAIYATFALQERSAPHSDAVLRLQPSSEFWPLMAKALDVLAVVDAGFPKPRAEFLVYGSCHAQEPVQASEVFVSVGELKKRLLVFGPRRWSASGIERFGAFNRISLDCFHAFGGPDFDRNPFGMGHESANSPLLPHVEDPRELVGAPADKPSPAGFFALPAHWPQRSRHLGTIDEHWQQQRWPHLPEDTSPEYVQAAPVDQRLSGFFRGDEKVRIENMHPRRPVIQTTLPGVRGRLFCLRPRKDQNATFSEIPLKADTLWLFPEQERGVLLFRGGFTSSDDELSDIECFYAAWESLEQAPLSVKRHHELLREKFVMEAQAEETGPAEDLSEDDPSEPLAHPQKQDLPAGAVAAGAAAGVAGLTRAAQAAPSNLEEMDTLNKQLEETLAQQIKEADLSEEEIKSIKNIDSEIEQEVQEKEADADGEINAFMREQGKTDDEIAAMPPAERMDMTNLWLENRVRTTLEEQGLPADRIQQAFQEFEAAGTSRGELDLDMEQNVNFMKQLIQDLQQQGRDTAQLETAFEELRVLLSELSSLAVPVAGSMAVKAAGAVEQASPQEPLPVRERVSELQLKGQSLAGMDLQDADLSGLDLSDCDLTRANLRGANLEHCTLSRARLEHADLREAQLSHARCDGANLRKARLELASAQELQARGACFAEADCSRLQLVQADLEGADFSKCRLENALFEQCFCANACFSKSKASGAEYLDCDFSAATFEKAELAEASFTGSRLDGALLLKAQAPGLRLMGVQGREADFTGCVLTDSYASHETCLDRAVFEKAELSGSSWTGASLREARFFNARLDNVDFSKTSLHEAHMRHCRMRGADFSKARLHKTDMAFSDLMLGSLRKAELIRTDLYHANLFSVDLYKATLDTPNLQRANLKRTLMAQGLP